MRIKPQPLFSPYERSLLLFNFDLLEAKHFAISNSDGFPSGLNPKSFPGSSGRSRSTAHQQIPSTKSFMFSFSYLLSCYLRLLITSKPFFPLRKSSSPNIEAKASTAEMRKMRGSSSQEQIRYFLFSRETFILIFNPSKYIQTTYAKLKLQTRMNSRNTGEVLNVPLKYAKIRTIPTC